MASLTYVHAHMHIYSMKCTDATDNCLLFFVWEKEVGSGYHGIQCWWDKVVVIMADIP